MAARHVRRFCGSVAALLLGLAAVGPAGATLCSADRPLDEVTDLDFFRGLVTDIRGEGDSRRATLQILEDYSGVGDTVTLDLARHWTTLSPGQSVFLAAVAHDGMHYPAPCSYAYTEERVAAFMRTGSDPYWGAARVCGGRLQDANVLNPDRMERWRETPACRADLATLSLGGGPTGEVARLVMEPVDCALGGPDAQFRDCITRPGADIGVCRIREMRTREDCQD